MPTGPKEMRGTDNWATLYRQKRVGPLQFTIIIIILAW